MAYKFNFIEKSKVISTELYDSSVQWLSSKYNQSIKVFSLSSGFGQLLQVLNDLQQLNLYYIEDSVTELNILTATRDKSILGLTTLNGHNPTRAIAAKGELELYWNGKDADLIDGLILLQNLLPITCNTNSLDYLLKINADSLAIELDQSKKYQVNIIQGKYEVQIFNSDGSSLQSYYVQVGPNDNVDNYEVNVYVNSVLWKKYDSFYDMPRNSKSYMVKTGILPGIDVFFGNSDYGLIPSAGSEIRVEYLKTNGSFGYLNPNQVHIWSFNSPGYNQYGTDIDLNSVLSIKTLIAPLLGSDGEDIALTKLIGTRTSRSYVLINADSYIIFFEKYNIYSIVRAWNILDDFENNIIYILLVPDIKKKLSTGQNYFTVNLQEFTLTNNEKKALYQLLDESGSKIIGTNTQIVDVILKNYIMNINIKIFEGYEKNNAISLKNEIVSSVSTYMLNFNRVDAIPKSDFINIIEDITGVDSVSVNFVSQENEIFKSTPSNISLLDLNIDEFGDILINNGELPVIRGGWTDRNGIQYLDGIDYTRPSSININVKSVTKLDYLNSKNIN